MAGNLHCCYLTVYLKYFSVLSLQWKTSAFYLPLFDGSIRKDERKYEGSEDWYGSIVMSCKSNDLVSCPSCGVQVKRRRLKHHLRHHCVMRRKLHARKPRVYRIKWGRKMPAQWDGRTIVRKVVRKSSSLAHRSFYVEKGRKVVFRDLMPMRFHDDFTVQPHREPRGLSSVSWGW